MASEYFFIEHEYGRVGPYMAYSKRENELLEKLIVETDGFIVKDNNIKNKRDAIKLSVILDEYIKFSVIPKKDFDRYYELCLIALLCEYVKHLLDYKYSNNLIKSESDINVIPEKLYHLTINEFKDWLKKNKNQTFEEYCDTSTTFFDYEAKFFKEVLNLDLTKYYDVLK